MLTKLNRLLNIIMGAQVGVFIGHTLFTYFHYRNHQDLYAAQSAPWYTSIIMYGTVTAIVLLIAIVLKYIVKKKFKSKQIGTC